MRCLFKLEFSSSPPPTPFCARRHLLSPLSSSISKSRGFTSHAEDEGGAKKVEEEEEHNRGLPPLLRSIHGRGRVRGGGEKRHAPLGVL